MVDLRRIGTTTSSPAQEERFQTNSAAERTNRRENSKSFPATHIPALRLYPPVGKVEPSAILLYLAMLTRPSNSLLTRALKADDRISVVYAFSQSALGCWYGNQLIIHGEYTLSGGCCPHFYASKVLCEFCRCWVSLDAQPCQGEADHKRVCSALGL